MNRIAFSLLIGTLLIVYSASAQTSRAGDGVGAAQVDAIYPDIEKLYIDLHRNSELAFMSSARRRRLRRASRRWGMRSRPASAAPVSWRS
jgi:hypothetical protein